VQHAKNYPSQGQYNVLLYHPVKIENTKEQGKIVAVIFAP